MRVTNSIRVGVLMLGAAIFMVTSAFNTTAAQTNKANKATQASKTMVDVNSADVKELETLPGITPALANKIVDGRPYKSMADLQKVKGLSKTKLDAITNNITFGPGTAAAKEKTQKSAKKTTQSGQQEKATASKEPGTKTPSPTGAASGKLAPGQTVNINTATAEQLDALSGIGPTKAQAIVDYRNQNGPFNSIEDIQKVKGIKEGEFSKIKDQITVK